MTPETWAEIRRLFHVEKLSQREIARHLKIDRGTVRRALKRDHAPTKPSRVRGSIVDSFRRDVEEILAETPNMTGVRMLEELGRRGFKGRITAVRDFLAKIRGERKREAYVRRVFHPGEAAEVDWAHCGSVEVGGRSRRVYCFVMVLCYSRMAYLEFTISEAMEEFLRCHQNAFAFFGGVPRKCFYDNLKSVVLARAAGEIRWNPRFMDFAGHCLTKPVACNPASGWEKGRVERTIQYIRSSFLLGRSFRSLDELNVAAVRWRDEVANRRVHKTTGKRPVDLFSDDKARLLALPDAPYDTRVVRSVRVTPDCRVQFEYNTYSVPPRFVGQFLELRASPAEVSVYDGPSLVARHRRSYETHQDILDAEHAKAVLARKRKASGSTLQRLFLALAPEAEKYLAGLVKSEISIERHLRRILDLVATYGKAEVLGAILRALEYGAYGADYVENIVLTERRRRREAQKTPIKIEKKELAEIDLPEQKLDHYDQILRIPDAEDEKEQPE
jgi:transposase